MFNFNIVKRYFWKNQDTQCRDLDFVLDLGGISNNKTCIYIINLKLFLITF